MFQKFILSVLLLILCLNLSFGQSQKEPKACQEVRKLLAQQASDWNTGNIDAFMEGYHRTEKLKFIGSSGVTSGWEKTLANYKRGYPNKEMMGELTFELYNVKKESSKVVTVVGKFILNRKGEVENLSGHFLLVVTKKKGVWKIIADHTS